MQIRLRQSILQSSHKLIDVAYGVGIERTQFGNIGSHLVDMEFLYRETVLFHLSQICEKTIRTLVYAQARNPYKVAPFAIISA